MVYLEAAAPPVDFVPKQLSPRDEWAEVVALGKSKHLSRLRQPTTLGRAKDSIFVASGSFMTSTEVELTPREQLYNNALDSTMNIMMPPVTSARSDSMKKHPIPLSPRQRLAARQMQNQAPPHRPRGSFGDGLGSARPLKIIAEMNGAPPWTVIRAGRFDARQRVRSAKAQQSLSPRMALRLQPIQHTTLRNELQRTKFVEPDSAPGNTWQDRPLTAGMFHIYRHDGPVEVRPPSPKAWKLEESIWKGRSKWADSGSFLDTEEVYDKAFSLDWSQALRAHGLAQYIRKNDDGESDDGEDDDGDGVVDDEIVEVGNALYKNRLLLYRAFDVYAVIGSSSDWTHISPGGFKTFCTDCGLEEKGSKTCAAAHLDGVFLLVNRTTAKNENKAQIEDYDTLGGKLGSATTEVKFDDNSRALNRMEFMQCLVRVAIMKYVQAGVVTDASEAVERLFEVDIAPRVGETAKQDSNAFRQDACYTESTDDVLLLHKESLQAVFEAYAAIDGSDIKTRHLSKLMSSQEWISMLHSLMWIDDDFTHRDATLAFIWARMRVADEFAEESKLKLQNLCYEDFLEALVRVATMKALPTDEEVEEASCADGGEMLLKLRKTHGEYVSWVAAHSRPFDAPLPQPAERAVHHLCLLLIRSIKSFTRGKGKFRDNLVLTKPEAALWQQKGRLGKDAG